MSAPPLASVFLLFLAALLLGGCATQNTGTSAVRHGLTAIRERSTAISLLADTAARDGKEVLSNLRLAQRDAKEIRRLLR